MDIRTHLPAVGLGGAMLGGPGGLHLSSLRQGGEQQPLVGHGPPSSRGGLSGGLSGPVLDPMPKGEASPMKSGQWLLGWVL